MQKQRQCQQRRRITAQYSMDQIMQLYWTLCDHVHSVYLMVRLSALDKVSSNAAKIYNYRFTNDHTTCSI